eukprot:g1222.t1
MSEPTAEERTGLALAACFNDRRRHLRLIGHQARTFDFQFHPTEDVAVSASEDGTARVWDLTNGRCAKSLEGHNKKHEVLRACWAPPGAWGDSVSIATGSADGIVRLWGTPPGDRDDDETGVGRYRSVKVVGQLRHRNQAKGLDGQVYSCQFIADTAGTPQASASPTGLLTASDSSVHLWDVETRTRVSSRALSKVGDHSIGGERNPEDMSFVFDAKPRPGSGSSVLAVALSDGTVRVGDVLREGEQAAVLRGASNTHLTSLAWSADGTILVSCGGNGSVTVWDTRTWTVRSVLYGHSRAVYGAAFHPGNAGTGAAAGVPAFALGGDSPLQLLLSWSSDESVCLWDAARATGDGTAPLATLAVEEGFPVYSCSISADGGRFAVAGGGSGGKSAGFLGVPIKLIGLDDLDDGSKQENGDKGCVGDA